MVAVAIALFFALVFGASGILAPTAAQNAPVQAQSDLVGAKAPYLDLPDVAGNHVSLDSLSGTPIVLVFWSTWSSTAADQIDILDSFLQSASPESSLVKVIAVDSEEDRSVAASFMKRGGYRVQALVDASGEVSQSYDIKSLPTTYFIDRSGIIRDAYAGVLSEKLLVDKIDLLLQ